MYLHSPRTLDWPFQKQWEVAARPCLNSLAVPPKPKTSSARAEAMNRGSLEGVLFVFGLYS